MSTTVWTLILVAIIVAFVAAGWLAWHWHRTRKMKQQFGSEYDHVLEEKGNRRQAERELQQRQERVEQLDIRPLSDHERKRYADRWKAIQADFVDEPAAAIAEAHKVITEVMNARGYPVTAREDREADLSVEYAELLQQYRDARRIARKPSASTEDLRQALVHYRALFGALLEEGKGSDPQEDRRHRVA